MDDILITGSCRELVSRTKEVLKSAFEMKDLGIMRYFLGMEINKTRQCLFLNQKKYILELLEETGMSMANSARTPLEANVKLSKIEGEVIAEKNGFQRLIGKLIYQTTTRPDITYAVNLLRQFMHCPRRPHAEAAHHVLRYLKGTTNKGLHFKNRGTPEITAYSDANWAGDISDRKSTT